MQKKFFLFFHIFIFKSMSILVKVKHPSSPDEIFTEQSIESVADMIEGLEPNSFISLSDFSSQSHEIQKEFKLKNMTLLFKFLQTYLKLKCNFLIKCGEGDIKLDFF